MVQKLAQIGPKTGLHGIYVLNGKYVNVNELFQLKHISLKQNTSSSLISLHHYGLGGPKLVQTLAQIGPKWPRTHFAMIFTQSMKYIGSDVIKVMRVRGRRTVKIFGGAIA